MHHFVCSTHDTHSLHSCFVLYTGMSLQSSFCRYRIDGSYFPRCFEHLVLKQYTKYSLEHGKFPRCVRAEAQACSGCHSTWPREVAERSPQRRDIGDGDSDGDTASLPSPASTAAAAAAASIISSFHIHTEHPSATVSRCGVECQSPSQTL